MYIFFVLYIEIFMFIKLKILKLFVVNRPQHFFRIIYVLFIS